ncbi:MAG: PIN domain-containing protein [Actinomycetota bacterium]|nr:PIN domain-containing protein [Rubrobacter sp.]MDQ3507534.1 PIN domain-containing protein [Actinomycetota bacterium]
MSEPLVVIDTGVVISALVGSVDASSYKVCRAVGTGRLRLAVSDRFLSELVRTVRDKHAEGRIPDAARAFEIALDLGFHGEHHVFESLPWPSVPDPGDYWIPNLAYFAETDFIVSNDPHMLDAELPIPVEVITASEMRDKLGL